jgi:hypothetical protein
MPALGPLLLLLPAVLISRPTDTLRFPFNGASCASGVGAYAAAVVLPRSPANEARTAKHFAGGAPGAT